MKLNWHDVHKPPAVVIGLNINGLGTVRSLGRKGIPVISVATGERVPSEYTRYCKKIICKTMTTSYQDLLECLIDIGKKLPAKTVVFPSGDLYLMLLSEHREVLDKYYFFPFPDKETVRLILDKRRFYRLALEKGWPIAKTYFPKSIEEVKQIAQEIRFPCLIKPSWAGYEWRKQRWKLLLTQNAAELLDRYRVAFRIHPELVIQEVTPGPDSALFFSLTYLNGAGETMIMFTGRKLRQFVPRFGISSMAESLWTPDIAEKTITVLKAINYTGYGSVEFKKDPRDGEFKMTEVTGRTWYPHALSEACGMNLPYVAYHDLLGLKLKDIPTSFTEHVKWIDEFGDFRSAYRYWREGELSLLGWIKSYRGKRAYATFAGDDLLPGVMFIYWSAYISLRTMLVKCVKFILGNNAKQRLAVAFRSVHHALIPKWLR